MPFDSDSFAFTVPIGDMLIDAHGVAAPGVGDISQMSWNVRATSSSSGANLGGFTLFVPGTTTLPGTPLTSGTYNLTAGGIAYRSLGGTASYTFNFTVTPEPVALGIVALAMIGMTRRRV